MNELVILLSKAQEVSFSRPEQTASALKSSIDRNYVHLLFMKTNTELGVELVQDKCDFASADFAQAKGMTKLLGFLILNYQKVRCEATIDLSTCKGKGQLIPLSDEEYTLLTVSTEAVNGSR